MNHIAIIVPTLNAGGGWEDWLSAFGRQTSKPVHRLVIDSSSMDNTAPLARSHDFRVEVIPSSAFNHGGTRQKAVDLLQSTEIIVFLTQDAVLATPDSLERLVKVFSDPEVGATYGRQLPKPEATAIAAHARLFNYPPVSHLRTLQDHHRIGLKTAFMSNSFAAYRRDALLAVGGFPTSTIMNEDTYVAGKLLLSGWKIGYCATAAVYHSHDYRLSEEFKRYFDIGVFHAREPWLRKNFGPAEGEGKRFVISELTYLIKASPAQLPSALLRTALKWLGFRAGLLERLLPSKLKRVISLHRGYWET